MDASIRMSNSFHTATVFIVDDITNPGQRVHWEGMFREIKVVSTQMVLSGHGPWMHLCPSFKTSHVLHMTESFKNQHINLADVVRNCFHDRRNDREMRWKLVNYETWLEKRNGATSGRFPMHCLALLTEAEKKANGEFKRAKGLEGFGKFWDKII